MFSNKQNFNNAFIPPPKKINKDISEVLLVIDSRDRDTQKYPNPSSYKIKLNKEFKFVKYLRLVQFKIPNSMYLIENDNNLLHFTEHISYESNDCNLENNYQINSCRSNEKIVQIPIGDYDIDIKEIFKKENFSYFNKKYLFSDQLTLEIESQFKKHTDQNIKVVYNKRKDNYWFITDFNSKKKVKKPLQLNFKGKKINYGDETIDKIIKRNQFDEPIRDENNNIIYEEVKNINTKFLFKENSIGKLLGFNNKNYNGYLGIYKNKNKNKILLDQNLKELITDQYLLIIDYENQEESLITTVNKIDEKYVILQNEIPYNKFLMYSGIIKSENRRSIKNTFKILKLKHCKKIYSTNKSIKDSFCILGINNENMNNLAPNYNDFYKKNFNPPIGTLDDLDITFLNDKNNLYKFNGEEHFLFFILGISKQSIKYLE